MSLDNSVTDFTTTEYLSLIRRGNTCSLWGESPGQKSWPTKIDQTAELRRLYLPNWFSSNLSRFRFGLGCVGDSTSRRSVRYCYHLILRIVANLHTQTVTSLIFCKHLNMLSIITSEKRRRGGPVSYWPIDAFSAVSRRLVYRLLCQTHRADPFTPAISWTAIVIAWMVGVQVRWHTSVLKNRNTSKLGSVSFYVTEIPFAHEKFQSSIQLQLQ